MTKECVLKLMDDQTNILNFKKNYDQNIELTEDEVKKKILFNSKKIIGSI